MFFRQVDLLTRHNEDITHKLLRDDELIEATWKRFHHAYICTVINTETEEEDTALLTDADLGDAEVIY